MELSVNTDWTYRGLRVVILENQFLRILILPEVGAKVWQITYKPMRVDLLWNNPRIPPARHDINTRYDDVWSGGWDELFPNDEMAIIAGESYPDHGELWTGKWAMTPFISDDEAGAKLSFVTPISSIAIEKTIVVHREERRVIFRHRFTNVGKRPFPFLWKLHPAMAVTPQHRIDFPPMQVVLDPTCLGTLAGAPLVNAWPFVWLGDRQVDLRCISPQEEQQFYFFYGTDMRAGWCALTNTTTGLACGLQFDRDIFACCWLFATYGGWRNYNVLVLEPCTGYPLDFAHMMAAGRECTIAPGETLSTRVLLTVQEGVYAVADVDNEGRISEGELKSGTNELSTQQVSDGKPWYT